MNTWNLKKSVIDKIKSLGDVDLYIQNISNEIILSIDDKTRQFLEKYKNDQQIMALINARAAGIGTKLPAMDSQDEQNCYLRVEELLNNIEKLYEEFSERWWFAYLGKINKLMEESILGNFIRKETIIKRNAVIIDQLLDKGNYEIADFYLEKLSPDKKIKVIGRAAGDKDSGRLILHFLSKYDFFDDTENQETLNKIIKRDINDFNQIIDMAVEARKKQINKKIFNFIENFFFYNKAEGKHVDLEYVYKNGFFMNVDNRYLHNGNSWAVGNIFCNTLAEKEIVWKYLPDMSENVRKAHIKLLINSGEFSIIKKVIENYDVDPYTNFGGFTHINYFLVGKIIEGGLIFKNNSVIETIKLALKKFPNEDSYKKYNILTFCLDWIRDAENGYNFFPLAEMIVEARRDLINKTDLNGKYPLDYVSGKKNEELKKILLAHGCTNKNKTTNEKFIGLLKGFMGSTKEVEAGRAIINSMESIYTSLNINSKKICDLIDDMPDELRLKIEKNLLLAKETLNFIGIEKNINLFEEGLIIEKNAGKFTLRALENYKRIGDLPNNGEHLENLNKQINLISEQIANIHQSVIKTINKDVEKQALINEEIIKKVNIVSP